MDMNRVSNGMDTGVEKFMKVTDGVMTSEKHTIAFIISSFILIMGAVTWDTFDKFDDAMNDDDKDKFKDVFNTRKIMLGYVQTGIGGLLVLVTGYFGVKSLYTKYDS